MSVPADFAGALENENRRGQRRRSPARPDLLSSVATARMPPSILRIIDINRKLSYDYGLDAAARAEGKVSSAIKILMKAIGSYDLGR